MFGSFDVKGFEITEDSFFAFAFVKYRGKPLFKLRPPKLAYSDVSLLGLCRCDMSFENDAHACSFLF